MGVTGDMFKGLNFGGASSKDYGVYITGEAVFNAPERNVEMIEIAGRNGAYVLDKGNFNNIEVTYPAGIYADTEADFANAISEFRNLLCSKRGYVRLTDDYNPNEYRMAIYKSGLEVSHDGLTEAEFNITFDCKPQRFLTSGETAVSVASGGTLTNPTLFPSHPQLQVNGYGEININSDVVTVENVPLGTIEVGPSGSKGGTANIAAWTTSVETANLATGDTFSIDKTTLVHAGSSTRSSHSFTTLTNCTATWVDSGQNFTIRVDSDTITFAKGTSSSASDSIASFTFTTTGGNTYTGTITVKTSYDGVNTLTHQVSTSCTIASWNTTTTTNTSWPVIFGNSTKTTSGNPLYIDLDIGEAWNTDNGVPVSLNNAVTLPAELPTLASGSNTITYDDNTITSFKVVPRWWKV